MITISTRQAIFDEVNDGEYFQLPHIDVITSFVARRVYPLSYDGISDYIYKAAGNIPISESEARSGYMLASQSSIYINEIRHRIFQQRLDKV